MYIYIYIFIHVYSLSLSLCSFSVLVSSDSHKPAYRFAPFVIVRTFTRSRSCLLDKIVFPFYTLIIDMRKAFDIVSYILSLFFFSFLMNN